VNECMIVTFDNLAYEGCGGSIAYP
jgi:hypothetical protein